jgi:hypothetical protein
VAGCRFVEVVQLGTERPQAGDDFEDVRWVRNMTCLSSN